jgi:hypothetical protein
MAPSPPEGKSVDSAPQQLTYQQLFRAVGAYLDRMPSCRITLAELSDGFLIRLHHRLHASETQTMHLQRGTLGQLIAHLETLAGDLARETVPAHKPQGLWAMLPNAHQDVFRALGYELDEAGARNVLIDELEEGMLLIYTYPESHEEASWSKRVVVLGLDELETILNTAFERRRREEPQPVA